MSDREIHARLAELEAQVSRLQKRAEIAGDMFSLIMAQLRINSKADAQAEADSAVLLALVTVLARPPHMQLVVQHALEKSYSTFLQQTIDDELLDHFRLRADEFETAIGLGPAKLTGG